VAPSLPTKLALEPEFDWVVGYKLALKPKFCCPLLNLGGANVTSGFAPLMLRPMAVKGVPPGNAAIVLAFAAMAAAAMAVIGIPPGDKGIAITFAATVVASAIVGGEDKVCNIIALLGY
jgi:hypothetical protein